MRYLVLACDYDGTIALDSHVAPETVAALEQVRASGRKLVLVTGRELNDLLEVFPDVGIFDRIVAENGALLYSPKTREEQLLGKPPPEQFIRMLREREITPLSVGRVIVATRHPHENSVLAAIRDLGLELQVVFNKGAVMVLPAGVNKATGLAAALRELSLSAHNVVGIGDAENDYAFLSACECSAAVANALPMLKEQVDVVTIGHHGAGVAELVEQLLMNDLAHLHYRLGRHRVHLGTTRNGVEVGIDPYGMNVLIAGPSGSGKSTVATALLERFAGVGYQFCILDPEGDYSSFEGAVVLGDMQRPPTLAEIIQLLEKPDTNLVVSLIGVRLEDRPAFFAGLLARLQELKVRTGRPHWLVLDEAHHLLPASWDAGQVVLPQRPDGWVLISVYPEQVSPVVVGFIDTAIAVGPDPMATFQAIEKTWRVSRPPLAEGTPEPGEVVFWPRDDSRPLRVVTVVPSRMDRKRHLRKYVEGEMEPERSFYFRGPEGKLRLRAQNLQMFMQLAEGVDDETWLHHLRRGDYSQWFREMIKDGDLADVVKRVEHRKRIGAAESRRRVKAAIEERYVVSGMAGQGLPGNGMRA